MCVSGSFRQRKSAFVRRLISSLRNSSESLGRFSRNSSRTVTVAPPINRMDLPVSLEGPVKKSIYYKYTGTRGSEKDIERAWGVRALLVGLEVEEVVLLEDKVAALPVPVTGLERDQPRLCSAVRRM